MNLKKERKFLQGLANATFVPRKIKPLSASRTQRPTDRYYASCLHCGRRICVSKGGKLATHIQFGISGKCVGSGEPAQKLLLHCPICEFRVFGVIMDDCKYTIADHGAKGSVCKFSGPGKTPNVRSRQWEQQLKK